MNESQLRAANNDGMDPFWKTDHIPSVETPNLIKRLEDEISRLKAKLQEVPWTKEESEEAIKKICSHGGCETQDAFYVAEHVRDWAEKRIKERQ